jgi:hypothetical protein
VEGQTDESVRQAAGSCCLIRFFSSPCCANRLLFGRQAAPLTKRLIASEDLIVVGAAGMYEARCRRCFEPNLASLGVASQKKKTELAATAGSK